MKFMMIKNSPYVSVIIPTYNRANLLSKSIQSVLNQTYTNFELIIVDDGSNDHTEDAVKNFEDERIRYIRHDKNKGLAGARNTGIRFSKGELLSFQDDDDEWLPNKLEKEIKVLKKSDSNVGVVYSGLCKIDGDKKTYWPEPMHTLREGNLHNELIKGNFVHSLTLIRRSCFEKVGLYDEDLRALEDWELYIRISAHYDFKFIDEALIITHLRADGLTKNLSLQLNCTEKIFKKHSDEYNKQKKAMADIYRVLASRLCLNRQLAEGRSCYIKSIKKDPTNIHCYSGYIVSLLGLNVYKKILDLSQIILKY